MPKSLTHMINDFISGGTQPDVFVITYVPKVFINFTLKQTGSGTRKQKLNLELLSFETQSSLWKNFETLTGNSFVHAFIMAKILKMKYRNKMVH